MPIPDKTVDALIDSIRSDRSWEASYAERYAAFMEPKLASGIYGRFEDEIRAEIAAGVPNDGQELRMRMHALDD